jgi:transposase-like protein
MNETTDQGAKRSPSVEDPAKTGPGEETDDDNAEMRARPGRRSVEERQRAVLDLFAGKATVDQIARRLGVLPETVESWRQDALGGMEEALRRGTGKTAGEVELERKNRDLEKFVTKLSIQKCLLEQALEIEREKRPTGPAKSKR